MKKLNKNSRKTYYFGLLIIMLTIIVIAISYAWYSMLITGTKSNTIITGNLVVTIDDASSLGINIPSGTSMTDADGVLTSPYTFTISNTGNIPSNYTIYLDDDVLEANEVRLSDSYIKYNLGIGATLGTTALLSTTGINPNRIIGSGSIDAESSLTFNLRMWLTGDLTGLDFQTFRGSIRVVASQQIETID